MAAKNVNLAPSIYKKPNNFDGALSKEYQLGLGLARYDGGIA